jgi:hypothetical protein
VLRLESLRREFAGFFTFSDLRHCKIINDTFIYRLFSFITKNWRGKPLVSLETTVDLIANTTTEKGLEIRAMKDTNIYQKGIKVTDEKWGKLI